MARERVAILFGGYSGEYEVSQKSARFVERYTDKDRYEPCLLAWTRKGCTALLEDGHYPVDLNDLSFEKDGVRYGFDIAFIAIHGSPGEDGRIQGYLDMIGIPYTTGGVLNTSLTFDKAFCKEFFKSDGIHTAEHLHLTRGDEGMQKMVEGRIGLPCFVKPNRGGSSLGNSKVTEPEELEEALEKAFDIDDEILVEELLDGTEIGCGVLRYEGRTTALPLIEIISKNDFFDYEAKYLSDATEEITPARISELATQACQKIAAHLYDRLRCKGMIRVDLFLLEDGTPSVIEVNTVPGLSDASLFPQEAKAHGLRFQDLISAVIEDAKRGATAELQ
jgi:D-alanine-D-alanine ligase